MQPANIHRRTPIDIHIMCGHRTPLHEFFLQPIINERPKRFRLLNENLCISKPEWVSVLLCCGLNLANDMPESYSFTLMKCTVTQIYKVSNLCVDLYSISKRKSHSLASTNVIHSSNIITFKTIFTISKASLRPNLYHFENCI